MILCLRATPPLPNRLAPQATDAKHAWPMTALQALAHPVDTDVI